MTLMQSAATTVGKQVFRDVVGRFASGVTVITTSAGGQQFGTTASAMSSLSLDPPMLLICLNRTSSTQAAVLESGTFAVNILSDGQEALAGQFARKGDDKFAGVAVRHGDTGAPLLDGSLATLECRTVETVTGGTHTVFLAEVLTAEARDLDPLTYFRGRFGRLERAREAEAYRSLRDWILARKVPTGQTLDLSGLAQVLETEPEHLSTALLRLSSENLLTRTEEGRFQPTPITVEMADGLFNARCAIEVGVADAHVATMSREQVDSLRDLAHTLMLIVNEAFPDIDRFLEASHRYHAEFVGLSGCPQLTEAFTRLGIAGVWRNAIADRDWWNMFDVTYHHELTQALADRSPQRAKSLIYAHTDQVKGLVRQIITDGGGQI